MKFRLFIPLVISLVISGIWLASQRRLITKLEQKSSILHKSIATRLSGVGDDSQFAKKAASATAAKEMEPLDWKKIAAQFAKIRDSYDSGNTWIMLCFEHRLQSMTKEELVAALDEITALDLPVGSRAMLEKMIAGSLLRKDPERAFTRFVDRFQDQNSLIVWELCRASQEWVEKDPTSAVAWLDEQIAAGKFDSKSLDGKSHPRQQFEGALLNVLLTSDLDAAARRLGAIPEDQRRDIMTHHQFQFLKEENQFKFAKLVRSQVPIDAQADTLAQQAGHLVSKGYSEVTEYLDRIEATTAERAKCAEVAAESKMKIHNDKKITRENLDEMREWVAIQAPEALASITLNALCNAMLGDHKMEFSEAADLAVQYNQTSVDDEVLASFLESRSARENKELARVLTEKITDGKRREEILKHLR